MYHWQELEWTKRLKILSKEKTIAEVRKQVERNPSLGKQLQESLS